MFTAETLWGDDLADGLMEYFDPLDELTRAILRPVSSATATQEVCGRGRHGGAEGEFAAQQDDRPQARAEEIEGAG